MHKVVWHTEDGSRHEREFDSMDNAQAFQEYLVFSLGLDAEVEE